MDALDYQPPKKFVQMAKVMTIWHELYFDPQFIHAERIPTHPRFLLVGFHSMLAYDFPYMWYRLQRDFGLNVRALTDKYLFAAPVVGNVLSKTFGHVEGTRENCRRLMTADQTLAVYPGGSREALHPRNQAHQMNWGSRDGFVRMALEFGYTMVPFAAVGIDDQWDYLVDGQQFAHSKVGRLIKKTGLINRDDLFPPLFKSLMPRPNRHYYGFGHPIEVPKVSTKSQTDELVRQYRGQAADAVQGLLTELQARRSHESNRRFLDRFSRHR